MDFYAVNRDEVRCPTCGKRMVSALSIRGTYSRDWLRCSDAKCMTFYNTWIPMPYQKEILEDPHRRLGVFGGYGCGKTTTTYKSDEKHILTTPNGETLIGASTLIQLENTIKKDFEGDFPAEFVKNYNKQKGVIEFVNGHILYYRPLEDEGDIRSYNLTRAHILEASEVKHDAYIQLQTRVRNEHAMKPRLNADGSKRYRINPHTKEWELEVEYDWLQMLVESNPDSGWIKSEFLMRSGSVKTYDRTQNYVIPEANARPGTTSYIIPTKANYNLPPHFYEDLAADKPNWWIRRYLEGSFEYSEGMVYPNYSKNVIAGFQIPKHWPWMIAYDYGLNDNSHFVFLALDFYGETFGKPAAFAAKELVMSDSNITQLAGAYKSLYRNTIQVGGLYRTPVMDAMSFSKRHITNVKKTIGSLFADEGCVFNPAQMDKDARIYKTNAFIDTGMLFFFKEGVPVLISEMSDYKYPDKSLLKNTKTTKPVDKNDHGIAALEFGIMELPNKMRRIGETYIPDVAPDAELLRRREYGDSMFPTKRKVEEDPYEGFAPVFHQW